MTNDKPKQRMSPDTKNSITAVAAATVVAVGCFLMPFVSNGEAFQHTGVTEAVAKKIANKAHDNNIGKIYRITSTPLGLYEVVSAQGVFYLDPSLKYAMNGDIISLDTGKDYTSDGKALYKSQNALNNSNEHTSLVKLLANEQQSFPSPPQPHYIQTAPVSFPGMKKQVIHSTGESLDQLGTSLINHLNNSNKPLSQNEYIGTVEGQEAVKAEREKYLNEIRMQHGLAIKHDIAQAKANGQAIIPKIGYDEKGNKLTTEQTRAKIAKFVSTVNDTWTVVHHAQHEKAKIVVFTSYTCGYCRRLDNALPELNNAGITVAYINFPRTGTDIETENMRDAWCAVDQKTAFEKLYHGQQIPSYECKDLPEKIKKHRANEDAIIDQFMFGKVFGVQGTPTILTNDGRMFTGFSGANNLISKVLNK